MELEPGEIPSNPSQTPGRDFYISGESYRYLESRDRNPARELDIDFSSATASGTDSESGQSRHSEASGRHSNASRHGNRRDRQGDRYERHSDRHSQSSGSSSRSDRLDHNALSNRLTMLSGQHSPTTDNGYDLDCSVRLFRGSYTPPYTPPHDK
jgi:hypothetical protein